LEVDVDAIGCVETQLNSLKNNRSELSPDFSFFVGAHVKEKIPSNSATISWLRFVPLLQVFVLGFGDMQQLKPALLSQTTGTIPATKSVRDI
jgi:hypothetical protein